MLAQLQHTRLESIEFVYLVVGHTHDIVDAIFSQVGRAVAGHNILCVPEFFALLQRNMKPAPVWRHLRDVFGFKDSMPRYRTADIVKGVAGAHHLQIFWTREGTLALRCKRWVSSSDWCPALELCSRDQVEELRQWFPPVLSPAWDPSFAGSARAWLGKLRQLLAQTTLSASGLDHCEQLLSDGLPEFLPTGRGANSYIHNILRHRLKHPGVSTLGSEFVASLAKACSSIFPGSAERQGNLVTIQSAAAGAQGYDQAPLEVNEFCLYVQPERSMPVPSAHCPIRLGRVLRLVHEAAAPYAVIEAMWPVMKGIKHGQRTNLFGTWIVCSTPVDDDVSDALGMDRQLPSAAVMVELHHVLVWPVDVERGASAYESGCRIPFSAFRRLRDAHGLDLSGPAWAFSDRARKFQ